MDSAYEFVIDLDIGFRRSLCSNPYVTLLVCMTAACLIQAFIVIWTTRRVFGTSFPSDFVKNEIKRREKTKRHISLETPEVIISQGKGSERKKCFLGRDSVSRISDGIDEAVELRVETKKNTYGLEIKDPEGFGLWLEGFLPRLKQNRLYTKRSRVFWKLMLVISILACVYVAQHQSIIVDSACSAAILKSARNAFACPKCPSRNAISLGCKKEPVHFLLECPPCQSILKLDAETELETEMANVSQGPQPLGNLETFSDETENENAIQIAKSSPSRVNIILNFSFVVGLIYLVQSRIF